MMLKLTMIGTVLAGGLIAGASQAKAEVVHVNVRPAAVYYAQPYARPRARSSSRWHRRYHDDRPVVVAPAPATGYGVAYGYAAAANPQDPSVFAAQIRGETTQAAQDLRFDVRQGVVEQQALASLEADRQEIERDLAAASAKGYITAEDRAHLEQHVQEIRDLRSQFRCAPAAEVTYRR